VGHVYMRVCARAIGCAEARVTSGEVISIIRGRVNLFSCFLLFFLGYRDIEIGASRDGRKCRRSELKI